MARPVNNRNARKPDARKTESRGGKSRDRDQAAAPRGREKPDRSERPERFEREQRERAPARAPMRQPQIWGLHAFRAAWLNPRRHIGEAWLTQNAAQTLTDTLATPGLRRPAPRIVDGNEFKELFREDVVHQGAALWGEPLQNMDFDEFLSTNPTRVVVLDQVTDPHNVGAILRTACAFGFDGLVMQDRHAPPLSGTLAKVATGAIDYTPVLSVVNVSRAIEQLKELGFFAIGLAEEESVPFASVPSYEKVALVMGAEGEGLRDGVRKACDLLAALPTTGPIRSLNVSAAASAAIMALSIKSA